MKITILNLALAASLAAAQPHGHGHGQFHQKKASPVEKREPDVVTTLEAATATAYVLGDKIVTPEEAQAGIEKGLYIVVGETTPKYTPPAVSSSTIVSSSTEVQAQFLEKTSTVSPTTSTTSSTPAPIPTTTSTHAAVSSTYAAVPATTSKTSSSGSSSSSSGATGVDAEFPSGEIDCTDFPSDYGAVAVDWLGTGGWTSIQQVPDYTFGVDSVISYIVAAISGENCSKGSFCSYACPAGYVKAQFPAAQGATGQSIGGLYCNSNGKLELTRDGYTTLCQKGCGGVSVVNNLSKGAAICRTDYPSSESMVIPSWADAGSTIDLANIESAVYYEWDGKPTTLQYYVNQQGVSVEDACVWNSPTNPTDGGNWAPVNIGVGKDSFGITYLSIFPNLPTSTAKLNYNIKIEGDISGECALTSGTYTGGSTTGCTVGISDGGSATITFTDS
ncbi:beta-glucosidase [Xylariales sp. AK1849]|nr:beta-glucosidase [Xylariales sp. AK1849]